MVRLASFDKNGLKKGAWSPDEDRKLEAYVARYGHGNWRELPKFAGLKRCGKSCRLRWMNYLRPNIRRGNYTKEEEDLILELHQKHGNKWAMIAGRLSGRTDNEIKNHWHTHLKKRQSNNGLASSSVTDNMTPASQRSLRGHNSSSSSSSLLLSADPDYDECFRHVNILESCPVPLPTTSSNNNNNNSNNNINIVGNNDIFDDMLGDSLVDFDLTRPVEGQGHLTTSCSSVNSATLHVYKELEGDDDFWTNPFTLEDMTSSYDDLWCTAPSIHGLEFQ